MTALSELLAAANAAGLSARSLARQAQQRGFTINHDTAARYLRGDHGRPDEDTLRAFASVLPVRLADLRAAADLPAEETEPYQPPAEASRLTRRQRRAVDEIIRAMLEVPPAAGQPAPLAGQSTPAAGHPASPASARHRPRTPPPVGESARAARRGGAEPPLD